jgi:hypothetical protein
MILLYSVLFFLYSGNTIAVEADKHKNLTNIILCTGPAYNKRQQLIETTEKDLCFIPFKAIFVATTDIRNLGITFFGQEPEFILFKRRNKQLDCLNCILLSLQSIANEPTFADDDIILFKHESVYINDMNLIRKAIGKLEQGYDIVSKYWIGFTGATIRPYLNDYYHTDSFFIKVSAARKIIKNLSEITHFASDYKFCEEYFTNYVVNQLTNVYKINYHHSSWKDNELGFYHIPRHKEDPKWYWDKSNYDQLYTS